MIGVGCYRALALYLGLTLLGQTYHEAKMGYVEICLKRYRFAGSFSAVNSAINVTTGVLLLAGGLLVPSALLWPKDLLAKKTERKDTLS